MMKSARMSSPTLEARRTEPPSFEIATAAVAAGPPPIVLKAEAEYLIALEGILSIEKTRSCTAWPIQNTLTNFLPHPP